MALKTTRSDLGTKFGTLQSIAPEPEFTSTTDLHHKIQKNTFLPNNLGPNKNLRAM